MMLLTYIEAWVLELERVVAAFEAVVDEVEEALDEAERAGESDEEDLRHLEAALESAEQIAGLVKAANAALNDAIDAARLVVTNEQLSLPVDNYQVSLPTLGELDQTISRRVVATEFRESRPAPASPTSSLEPLPNDSIIIQGKYRLVRLLQRRPRVHLYLAQRLTAQQGNPQYNQAQQPLVAIRELVLADLSPDIRKQIEHAAFEEFVSPFVLGSPRLPCAGDRMCIENERHYLVMQLRPAPGQRQAIAVTLAELLLHQPHWPFWLHIETALTWGIQLCRLVARLHRMGAAFGDLNPATVLVDAQSPAAWAPVLLPSWPPPSQFWSTSTCSDRPARELASQVFPIAINSADESAFAAPEIFKGSYDERSDVYSLGAILYLLLTRYTPAAAQLSLRTDQTITATEKKEQRGSIPLPFDSGPLPGSDGEALIPPHLFNTRVSSELEQVLLRALSVNADDRYPSALALAEALENIHLEEDSLESSLAHTQQASKITKVVDWLKRELNE